MKTIKTRLRNRLSDCNCMKIHVAKEGLELSGVSFDEILDVFKETNRHIEL